MEYPLPQFGPDARRGQQAPGLSFGERLQLGHVQEPGPGGIRGPLRLRSEATGQEDQGVVGGAGQKVLPQPAFQPLAVLEGVEDQDGAGNVQEGAGRALEICRVPADETAVEFDDQPACRTSLVRQAPQQRRLSYAARPEHVERERCLRIAGQSLPEMGEFLLPAYESPLPCSAQSLPHGCHGGSHPMFQFRTGARRYLPAPAERGTNTRHCGGGPARVLSPLRGFEGPGGSDGPHGALEKAALPEGPVRLT